MATVLETAIRSVVTKGIYLLADFNRMRLGIVPHNLARLNRGGIRLPVRQSEFERATI